MLNSLILLFLLSFLPYYWLNRRRAKFYWESPFDKKIKIVPIFVLPYMAYFPYVTVGTLILIISKFNLSYLQTMIIGNLSASLVWYLLPNGVKRPDLGKTGISGKLLKLVRLVYERDKYDTNGFPSGHVFHSLIISYFLSLAFPEFSIVFIILGLLISMSTVLVKQHYIVDVFGGITVTVFAILALNIL